MMNLEKGHPLHTLTEEHKMILDFVEKLRGGVERISSAESYEEAEEDIDKLKHVAKHLVEAEKHHRREEEALFPELKEAGVQGPPAMMERDHSIMKPKKKELLKTVENQEEEYEEFLKKVKRLSEEIAGRLPQHIHKEDNILYPTAEQTIDEEKWKEIKEKCDSIGYCCFTPEE